MGYINIHTFIIHKKKYLIFIYSKYIYRRANGMYVSQKVAISAYGQFVLVLVRPKLLSKSYVECLSFLTFGTITLFEIRLSVLQLYKKMVFNDH